MPKIEKKEDVLYARVRPSNKSWLHQKAKKAGFDKNFSEWFDQWIMKLRGQEKRRNDARTGTK